jgi:protein gp37
VSTATSIKWTEATWNPTTAAAVLISGYPSRLYAELYEARGWRRLERTVLRPTSNTAGGRGAAAVEVIWSNRPLLHQARLLDHEVTGR